ncbi:phosphopentomutase [Aestuariibius insulae]|uniref:phosphopentomutase n=1 Tax=Aestuariibius insulae TaxID=2058287 RepID=UPI00345E5AF7
MARVFLVVMDSVGIGGAPDADRFFNGTRPDTGANTVLHIAEACAAGQAEDGRTGPLDLPYLSSLGLGQAVQLASGQPLPGDRVEPTGAWGAATEISNGKDTPSGHWELAGVPVPWDWHYFPDTIPAFPEDVVGAVCTAAETAGILGNCHASGTEIIAELGAEHLHSHWPICYTSADSVFQIAAHEEAYGLDRLLDLCAAIAPRLHAMKVGRVIARPFVGDPETGFRRTGNRKDFAIAPPGDTICDRAQRAGRSVHAIGKIGDIFSMHGIDEVRKGTDAQLMEHLGDLMDTAAEGALVFANFVEFDALYGHRRDISGYARHLEWFDGAISTLASQLKPDDLLILTADHGNDPSWTGTDHTRERVPVLVQGLGPKELGHIAFSDITGLVARHLELPE